MAKLVYSSIICELYAYVHIIENKREFYVLFETWKNMHFYSKVLNVK